MPLQLKFTENQDSFIEQGQTCHFAKSMHAILPCYDAHYHAAHMAIQLMTTTKKQKHIGITIKFQIRTIYNATSPYGTNKQERGE